MAGSRLPGCLDGQATLNLAALAFPSGSPIAHLRQAAIRMLLEYKTAGTMPASVFRQTLMASANPDAWAATPPFEGSKVKTVLVGAELVFKAKYVPGETSKAIVLDMEGLQQLAVDPSLATEFAPPQTFTPMAAPSTQTQGPPDMPSKAAPPRPGHKAAAAQAHQLQQGETPQPQEMVQLSICMMAMALYRPGHAGMSEALAAVRCKAACLLARTTDGPLGVHSMAGTHLGDALGKLAGDAWQALPSAGSRLQRLADNCLVVEPHNNNAAVRLDVQELQRASTHAATLEWRAAGVLGNKRGGAVVGPAEPTPPPAPLPVVLPLPAANGVVIRVPPALRDDAWGLAVAAACAAVWWPRSWHVCAAVLAVVGQPAGVAMRNGGRNAAAAAFFIKEVQRAAGCPQSRGVPPVELTPRQLFTAEPLLGQASHHALGQMVLLQLQPLAEAVLPGLRAAVAAEAQGMGAGEGGPGGPGSWPPHLMELPLHQLHQQAQPLARHLVHVLGGSDGPGARGALLVRCLQQLETLAGASPGPAALTPSPGPGPNPAMARIPPAAHGPPPHVQPQTGQHAQHVQKGPGQGQQGGHPPSMMGPGQGPGPGPGQPGPMQQPVYPVPVLLGAAYPTNDALSVVRRTIVATVAVSPMGPLGPGSATLSELCRVLSIQEPQAWVMLTASNPAGVLPQMLQVLNGAPGIALAIMHGTAELAVRFDLAALERAAMISGLLSTLGPPMGMGPPGQPMGLGPNGAGGPGGMPPPNSPQVMGGGAPPNMMPHGARGPSMQQHMQHMQPMRAVPVSQHGPRPPMMGGPSPMMQQALPNHLMPHAPPGHMMHPGGATMHANAGPGEQRMGPGGQGGESMGVDSSNAHGPEATPQVNSAAKPGEELAGSLHAALLSASASLASTPLTPHAQHQQQERAAAAGTGGPVAEGGGLPGPTGLGPQKGRAAPATAEQEHLTGLAAAVYSEADPLRELRLHTVHLLAGCLSGNAAPRMGGPELGTHMSRNCPGAWGTLVGSKLQKLCADDPFLRLEVQGDSRLVWLDVAALLATASTPGVPPGHHLHSGTPTSNGFASSEGSDHATIFNGGDGGAAMANGALAKKKLNVGAPQFQPVAGRAGSSGEGSLVGGCGGEAGGAQQVKEALMQLSLEF